MSDPAVARSLGNTVYYTALHVPLVMLISLGLALLLKRVGRLPGFFRTVFYLPVMTPAVAVGILFLLLLNTQDGLINRALGLLGIAGPSWTTDPHWVMPGIILMSLWSLGSHCDHLPGRVAERAPRPVRGGGHGRRRPLGTGSVRSPCR